jgi:hypothetical protein
MQEQKVISPPRLCPAYVLYLAPPPHTTQARPDDAVARKNPPPQRPANQPRRPTPESNSVKSRLTHRFHYSVKRFCAPSVHSPSQMTNNTLKLSFRGGYAIVASPLITHFPGKSGRGKGGSKSRYSPRCALKFRPASAQSTFHFKDTGLPRTLVPGYQVTEIRGG